MIKPSRFLISKYDEAVARNWSKENVFINCAPPCVCMHKMLFAELTMINFDEDNELAE